MRDNQYDLWDNFSLEFDPTRKRYGSGHQWICKHCGKPCHSTEDYYPCLGGMVTVRVRCRLGCGFTWKLEVDPEAEKETTIQ